MPAWKSRVKPHDTAKGEQVKRRLRRRKQAVDPCPGYLISPRPLPAGKFAAAFPLLA